MNKQEIQTGITHLAAHMTMSKNIQRTITEAKEQGQYAQVAANRKQVVIHRGPSDEDFFCFYDQDAIDLLQKADELAEEFGLWATDALIYLAQEM